jgi:hypothetical protein
MNHIEQTGYIQLLVEIQNNIKTNEICFDLRQAIKVVNAEYQQIDSEDSLFLTRVIRNALELLEAPEAIAHGTK